jgi:hypothetical protein
MDRKSGNEAADEYSRFMAFGGASVVDTGRSSDRQESRQQHGSGLWGAPANPTSSGQWPLGANVHEDQQHLGFTQSSGSKGV